MANKLLTIALLYVCASINVLAQTTYSFRHLTTDDGLVNNEVRSIVRDSAGYVFIGTAAGTSRYDGYRFKTINNDACELANGKDYTDRSGGKWKFSTLNDSVFYQKKGKGEWQFIPLYKHDAAESNSVRAIEDDGRGNVWIATDHKGIFIFNKATGEITNIRHNDNVASSLAEDNVTTLYLDRQGAMWVGYLRKGLSYSHPSFSKFNNVVSPQFANISAMAESHDGSLWIGTDGNGLLHRFADGRTERVDVPANIIVTLMEDGSHRLWIGTYQHGLICYDHGNTTIFTSSNSRLADNSVYSLCQDHNGRIWIGSLWGHLQCLDTTSGTFKDFTSQSKDQSIAQCMDYDGGRTLYVGMLSGVCIVDVDKGERKMFFGNRRGTQKFRQPNIQSIHRDSRGLLWLGHNNGISVWDMKRDTIYCIDKTAGLADNIVRGIAEDPRHRLWIATSNGCTVISVAKNDGRYSFTTNNYTTNDGLPTNDFSRNSTLQLHNGDILMGGIGGYAIVDMKKVDGGEVMHFPGKPTENRPIDWRIVALCLLPLLIALLIIYIMYRRRDKKFEQWKAAFLKDHKSNDTKPEADISPSKIEITPLDQMLLNKAVAIVEKNIADSDFTVEQLSEALGMTRGHLYKRLISITGKSPSDFIRIIRLKRGRQLLAESQLQVSEIAYDVGFSSPMIFSRNFKAEFGMTLTEFVKNKN